MACPSSGEITIKGIFNEQYNGDYTDTDVPTTQQVGIGYSDLKKLCEFAENGAFGQLAAWDIFSGDDSAPFQMSDFHGGRRDDPLGDGPW